MAKKKKPNPEWTDEEILKYVFPKKVRDELHRIAHEKDDPEDKDEDKETDSSRE